MTHPYITQELSKSLETVSKMLTDEALLAEVERASKLCIDALKSGKKLLFAGNGGSAADAQHLAAEIVSRLCYDRPGLPAIAITTDTSALTAISNDYSYDYVFARQLEALGVEGDVFIGISTSGNSANILSAIEAAKKQGLVTIGFTGQAGGKMKGKSDCTVHIPSDETPKIQEGHIMLGHIMCSMAEEAIFGEEYNPQRKG